MKSNQERSNECLPPKKRDFPASTVDERPLVMAPASESQRGENLAWLASVASGHNSGHDRDSGVGGSDGPQVVTTSLPAMYTSALSQPGGTIQYTQLPPNLQFIRSPYTGPYAGYISSQLLPPPPPTSTSQRSLPDPYPNTTITSQSQISVAPQTAPSPHGGTHHLPLHLHSHPHHTLALSGGSQVLVQYAGPGPEGPLTKREEGRPRELHNGEQRGRYERKESKGAPSSSSSSSSQYHQLHQQQSTQHHYEAYTSHDASGLRTSLMLVPNSRGGPDHHIPDKLPPSSASHPEKGSLLLGKHVSLSPHTHTVIQTTHSASDASPLSLGQLSSNTNFYQAGPGGQPIIGYLAGSSGGQRYHTSLPQHLLIPGAPGSQPIIIPVSGAGVTSLEAGHAAHIATTTQPQSFPTTLPHTYVTNNTNPNPNPKDEHLFEVPAPYPPLSHPVGVGGTVVQAQLHLPVVPAPTPPSSAPSSAPSLPPYFIKGSIIQLADGELKRVEDLKTEDFIQSAEISSELKIDSSTVERIDGSHTSNFAIVQFSVGEHRAQVSVEVLVEYPFFVFGQGWSSCCPDRTTQLLELPCTKLSVGDVCISLTLKNLRNGSLKKTQQTQNQAIEITTSCNMGSIHGPLKSSRSARHGEQENGVGQRGVQIASENGELRFGTGGEANSKGGQPGDSGSSGGAAKPVSRKRRWSAPEGRKVERSEKEPPLTLPKPSFITQEVKISIEGRSNIGK
uniref:Ataxin 1a n=1 Tax=Hucho hucho TaxID=62062 RepID=A0A4W5LB57_9TELE